MNQPLVVACGVGNNSVAMLLGMYERETAGSAGNFVHLHGW